MSLTATDLKEIRTIVREEVRPIVKKEVRLAFQTDGRAIVREEVDKELKSINERLGSIDEKLGKLEALENDVKEIYSIIARLEKGVITDESFQKLKLEAKLFRINAELIAAAEQAGVTLPRA